MTRRMRTSRSGLDLIKGFEGFHARAAQLPDGTWAIGYSHTSSARKGLRITRADAETVLREYDLPPVEQAICDTVFAPLNQNEFDALVSLSFNIGSEAFAGSEILLHLNAGKRLAAAYAMAGWRNASVNGRLMTVDALVRRRASEQALFLQHPSGISSAPSGLVRPVLDETVGADLPPLPSAETLVPAPVREQLIAPRQAASEPERAKPEPRLTRVLGAAVAPGSTSASDPRPTAAPAPEKRAQPTPDEITRAISALANPDTVSEPAPDPQPEILPREPANDPVSWPPSIAPPFDDDGEDLPPPPSLEQNESAPEIEHDLDLFAPGYDDEDEDFAALEDELAAPLSDAVVIDDLETAEVDKQVLQQALKDADRMGKDERVYLSTGLLGGILSLYGAAKLTGILTGPGFADQNLDRFVDIGSLVLGGLLLTATVYLSRRAYVPYASGVTE